jgi:hypothetical protein
MSGSGALASPWDIVTAMNWPAAVAPGNIINIRSGTHTGAFEAKLSGGVSSPITIRNYPTERVIIDGSLLISGSCEKLLGLELTHSTDPPLAETILLNTAGLAGKLSIINLIIHNSAGSGCGFWANVQPGLLYGTLIFFCGRFDPAHDHGIYTQNAAGIIKTIKDDIIYNNWGYGLHAYGDVGALDDISIIGDTFFGNGLDAGGWDLHHGGHTPIANPVWQNNNVYGKSRLGYGSGNTVTNAIITGNNFINPLGENCLTLTSCVPAVMTGNTFYGTVLGFDPADYPDNTYADAIPDKVIVRPNEYQLDRANVTVYNGASANSVTADLSAVTGLAAGDTVRVRNVQYYFVDIQTLTLDANKRITIDMQAANRTVQTPIGHAAPATTFPLFGCFVIEK